jgi:hypothetical protein
MVAIAILVIAMPSSRTTDRNRRPAPMRSDREAEVASKAAVRAAAILGLTNAELANVVGVSESQISRISNQKAVFDGKPLELGLLFIRLYRGLAGIVGQDDEAARSWLRSSNLALGKPPIELIASVGGLVNVVDYVDSRRARI